MVSSLSSSGSSSLPSYLSALTTRTGSSSSTDDSTGTSTDSTSSSADDSSTSIADQIEGSLAQQKKQNALDDVLRLKQQMADMAILELVNPEGAARMYGEMGKKLEHAASSYSEGTQTLAELSGDTTSLAQMSVSADMQAIVNSATPDSTDSSTDGTDTATTTTTTTSTTDSDTDSSLATSDDTATSATTLQKQLQAYAMASASDTDDHQALVDMKSLSGTLDERFRHAVATAEEQDQSEEKEREMDRLASDFAVSQAHTASALDALGQQISLSKASSSSLTALTRVSVVA